MINGAHDPWLDELQKMAEAQAARLAAEPDEEPAEAQRRKVRFTTGSNIEIARARWLWDGRIAVGTFTLLAGREGLGKSTVAYWVAARVTRGELPGEFAGEPRAVLICASEDAYSEVIIPRLIAAGARLDLVYRVDVITGESVGELSLPGDLLAIGEAAVRYRAALLLLDPLISRLGRADTHKDGETRQALEPLSAMAGATGMAVLGLIHHNKSSAADVLTQVMGSRAFTAVARSVHTVVEDPDDESGLRRLFGTVKNNLGPAGLPTLSFTIAEVTVGHDPHDGLPVPGSKVVWGPDSDVSVGEAFRLTREGGGGPTQTAEAQRVIRDLLDHHGGCITSKQAKAAGRQEGISEATMKRAAAKLRLVVESSGYPRTTTWTDPESVTQLGEVLQSDQGWVP